jgi:PKD repeat protein
MKKLLTVLTFALFSSNIWAQEPENIKQCGHQENYIEHCKKIGIDPFNNEVYNNYERELNEKLKIGRTVKTARQSGRQGTRSGPLFIIPVVFHIVHVGGTENISDAQVLDAIRVLNLDYRNLNVDTADVIPAFKPIVADCEIEFRLAQIDALGNCVSGITRTFSSETNVGTNPMVDAVNRNLNNSSDNTNIRFPHNMYLNIWICINPNGAAGYTGGPVMGAITPNYDGIWVRHDYVGAIGTSSVLRSRTLTHEVGHWLSLAHTWGGSNNPGCDGTIMTPPCSGADNCSIDDGVSDTPNTIGWTTCNLSGSSCGSTVDNIQNYMEYTYCNRMFTEGQKAKMHTLLGLSVAGRNNLYTPANLTATGVDTVPILCAADFSTNPVYVCEGDSLTFTDNSFNGATGWNYIFSGGTPINSTLQNPTITYNAQGTYDVGLIANNGVSAVNLIKSNYITVLDPVGAAAPISEGFESATVLPNNTWMISNLDGKQTWEIASGIAYEGSKCMMIDNFSYNGGGKDIFLSKTYDLSGVANAEIHFKYAYRQKTSGDVEKLKVYVSNNCGQSWSLRKQVIGTALSGSMTSTTAYTPAPADWMSYDVTNISAAYLTQGFMFKIEFESDKGNNIYLDNINLDVNVGIDENNFSPLDFSVYPNPTTNSATVKYELSTQQNMILTLKDVLGRELCVLDKGSKQAGSHSLNISGGQLNSKGMYFVCLSNGVTSYTQKIVVQ